MVAALVSVAGGVVSALCESSLYPRCLILPVPSRRAQWCAGCVLTQETADEGQGGAEAPQPSSGAGPAQGQAPNGAPGPGGPGAPNGPASPRVTTVKDLMASVIEVSLMKTQSAAGDTAPPTISSILNSENSFVGPGRDFRPASGPAVTVAGAAAPGGPAAAAPASAAAATTLDKQVVVVTNSHHAERPEPQLKDAANAHHPDLPLAKDGLVVLQVSSPSGQVPSLDCSPSRPRLPRSPREELRAFAPRPGCASTGWL